MVKTRNERVKVFYRIFPTEVSCWDWVRYTEDTIYVRPLPGLQESEKTIKTAGLIPVWEFNVDGVFCNKSQKDIYSEIKGDMVENLFKGQNIILTSFGQTGSGKSFTLGALELFSEEDLGITPQIINALFLIKQELPPHIKVSLKMSYVEFSQTSAIDLLKEYPNDIDMWHIKNEGTYVKIKSFYTALKCLYLGEARKQTVKTNKYFSHFNTSIVTIDVNVINLDISNVKRIHSKLHVIDMAGVDTIGNVSCLFKNNVQVGEANLMKLNFEKLFLCLISKELQYFKVKQRIHPLINFLDGDIYNCTMKFIGHLKITREDLPITLSMLRFGQLVKGLKPLSTEVTFEEDSQSKIERLEHQLETIKQENLQNSILLNQDLSRTLDTERIAHIQRLVQDYMKDQVDEISILNVAEASTVFKSFKEMCGKVDILEKSKSKMRAIGDVPKKRRSSRPTGSESIGSVKSSSSNRHSKDLIKIPEQKETTAKMVDISISVQSLIQQNASSSDFSKKGINTKLKAVKLTSRRASKQLPVIEARKSTKNRLSLEDDFFMKSIYLPDTMPDNEEAWKLFTNELLFKTFVDEFRITDEAHKESYLKYLEEVKNMQDLRDQMEERRTDLSEAQMFRRFNFSVSEEDLTREAILGEAEEICQNLIKEVETEYNSKQEEVLKLQSILRIHLSIKKELKKQMNKDFEMFCKDKYNIPLPNLWAQSDDDILGKNKRKLSDLSESGLDSISKRSFVKDFQNTISFDDFKKVLKKERTKDLKRRNKLQWK